LGAGSTCPKSDAIALAGAPASRGRGPRRRIAEAARCSAMPGERGEGGGGELEKGRRGKVEICGCCGGGFARRK
jgi:hypothetical protein